MSFRKPKQPPSREKGRRGSLSVVEKSSESIVESEEPGPSGFVATLPKKRKVEKKVRNLSESHSEDCDEEPFHDSSDSENCESVPSGRPARKWGYEDLQNIGIYYEENPEPFRGFMETVQRDILERFPECSNISQNVEKFSQLLKESVDFSYQLDSIRDFRKHMYKNKVAIEEKMIRDIQSNIEKSEEAEKNLDLKDMLSRKWLPAVKRFAYQTLKLIKKALYPLEEGVKSTVHASLGTDDPSKRDVEDAEAYEDVDENFIHHFCSVFGQLFFLEPDAVKRRTFYYKEQTVHTIPDLSYSIHLKPFAGVTDIQDKILFVTEVKEKPGIKSAVSLEDQVGSRVLGRVGSELFAETNFSVLKPNSLGIICIETKLIFVYLRMPEDHAVNVYMGGPLKTKGKISYTKAYDILSAEDRATVAEFLYFLGFVQNWHVC